MAKIGHILIDLAANVAGLQQDMQRASKTLDKGLGQMRTALKSFAGITAGYLGGQALLGYAQRSIEAADALNNMSTRTGVAVESLSALQYAAEMSDASMENLARGLKNISEWSTQAAAGNEQYAKKFQRFGIAVTDAAGALRPTEDILGDIADKLASMPAGAERMEAAMRLVGVEAGPKLLPMLSGGRAGLQAFREEAESLGVVISGETAQAAEAFKGNLDKLAKASQGVANSVMTELLPTLEMLTSRMVDAAKDAPNLGKAISTGMKLAVSSGQVAWTILDSIGRTLGSIAAMAVEIWNRNWSGVAAIYEDVSTENRAAWDGMYVDVAKTWGLIEDRTEKAAVKVTNAVVKPIKAAKAAIDEFNAATIRADLGMGSDEKFGTDITAEAEEDREWRDYQSGYSTKWRALEEKKTEISDDGNRQRMEDLRRSSEAAASYFSGAFTNLLIMPLQDGFNGVADILAGLKNILLDLLAKLAGSAILQMLLTAFGMPAVGGGGGILSLLGFSTGGIVPGSPTPGKDSVPSVLEPGEFVNRVAAVRHYGADFFERLNNLEVPRFAAGGVVAQAPATQPSAPTVVVHSRALDTHDMVAGIKRALAAPFADVRESRQSARMFEAMAPAAPRFA